MLYILQNYYGTIFCEYKKYKFTLRNCLHHDSFQKQTCLAFNILQLFEVMIQINVFLQNVSNRVVKMKLVEGGNPTLLVVGLNVASTRH